MDWQSFILQWDGLDDDQRSHFLQVLAVPESFIPLTVEALGSDDFAKIDALIEAINDEINRGIPSYIPFVNLLRKIKTLMVEHNSSLFDQLSEEEKKDIVRGKLDFPTEWEVDKNIFALIDGRVPSPSLSGSYTFEEKVAALLDDDALSEKLIHVYQEYQEYFRKKRGDAA